jgi:hypothetical protein
LPPDRFEFPPSIETEIDSELNGLMADLVSLTIGGHRRAESCLKWVVVSSTKTGDLAEGWIPARSEPFQEPIRPQRGIDRRDACRVPFVPTPD